VGEQMLLPIQRPAGGADRESQIQPQQAGEQPLGERRTQQGSHSGAGSMGGRGAEGRGWWPERSWVREVDFCFFRANRKTLPAEVLETQ